MTKIAVIPDTQIRPGDDFTFLKHIGMYLADKQPDVIVMIGDWADMPSLSSYDVGKKSFEGRRYKADIEASQAAMEVLLAPINELNEKAAKNHSKRYYPRKVLTLGNHCNRINRVVEGDSKLDGTISIDDLKFEKYGWEVYPFLQPVVINGIAFCHYFTSGILGRPCVSAQAQLTKKFMSCVAGHQQGFQMATGYRADGRRITSIIAGSCYEHAEEYLGPQGNHHFRGMLMLHNCDDGEFDLVQVPLSYLARKYGNS